MTGDQQSSDATNKRNTPLDVHFALQAAGLGVWEFDPVTNQIIWDDRCRELFGLATPSDLTYEQAIQYIHADDVERVTKAMQWAMNPQSDGVYDETFRTLGVDDGKLRWVRFYGRSSFSSVGEVYRFAGVAQDVTQQELARQQETAALHQAQRQQRMYEAITASTPDLVYGV
ncbi:PAS domain-containing protein [Spirosoma sp. KNUC1025]|uniref:PAS domain-containing protein n=1 Tax=Spirosoma sp. KNUC1025 TaxID=2894082 RepID=UPI003868FE2A|nr:PAS domain-containing protein [Spirosoma sp. KNUC1025]